MLNLLGQRKAQAMIINNHGLQLFTWQNNTLTFQANFTDSPESLNHFSQALITKAAFPAIIISNFMEESFLNETVAHVSGSDRNSLLERKLSYAFRTTPYRIAKVIGRESSGRRDDKILLSALNKPESLKPWIKIILDKKIPIQSITSSAYLAEVFSESNKLSKEENVLIVGLEKVSELRQTFLKDGKILFSRLTILQSTSTNSLSENIYNESLQIRNYLERIKAIQYDAQLTIHVYSSISNDDFSSDTFSSDLNVFENHNIIDQTADHSLELKGNELSVSAFFLSHTLQKKKISNIYGPFNVRRYFYLNTIAQTLRWSAAVLVLAFIVLHAPTLSTALDNAEQQQQVTSQTLPLTAEYEVLSRRFPETPIPSEEMALVVETYEKIKQQSYLPKEAFAYISEALTSSPELLLKTIDWELIEHIAQANTSPTDFGGLGGLGSTPSTGASSSIQQAIIEGKTELKITINGLVFSPNSYREAQNQVLEFIEALESYPEISVNPIKMPTDIRTDISVTALVDGEELQDAFILELTLGEVE